MTRRRIPKRVAEAVAALTRNCVPTIAGGLRVDVEEIATTFRNIETLAPASAVERWRLSVDRSEACARAVAAIVVRSPAATVGLPDLDLLERTLQRQVESHRRRHGGSVETSALLALAAFAEVRGQVARAEALLRDARVSARQEGAAERESIAAERLAALLEHAGRSGEADSIREELRAEQLLRQPTNANFERLRQRALELLGHGRYGDAERIYLQLSTHGFELASTHCHLARVYHLMDRHDAARAETMAAWEHRSTCSAYVVARIHFLRLLDALLSGAATRKSWLAVQEAMYQPGAQMEWRIQPVLDHVAHRLRKDVTNLLSALGRALSATKYIDPLEKLPAWRRRVEASRHSSVRRAPRRVKRQGE